MTKAPESAKSYSVQYRVRRVTVEDAYVRVHVTRALLRPADDGTLRLDTEALVAEALSISHDPRVEWRVETIETNPHPTQQPMPEDRRAFDSFYHKPE